MESRKSAPSYLSEIIRTAVNATGIPTVAGTLYRITLGTLQNIGEVLLMIAESKGYPVYPPRRKRRNS